MQEVADVLEKHGQLTAAEIAEYLKIGVLSTRQNLLRLQRDGEVELVEFTKEQVIGKGLKYVGRHFEWKLNEKEKEEF